MTDACQITELLVVRHGQTEWNLAGRMQGHLDSPLTDLGVRQAEAVAEALARETFDVLYSSDLGRATHTAEVIAARTGQEMVLEPGLRERRFGVFEGLTWAEIRKRYPQEMDAFERSHHHALPGGETSPERRDRVVACTDRLLTRHVGQRLCLVTHGGTLRCLLKHAAGLRDASAKRFRLPNAAINRFTVAEGAWKVEAWGDTHHLRHLSISKLDGRV